MSGRADKKAKSREYFDRHAESYESDRRWRRLREPRAEAVAALELQPDDRLLDVGCGSGLAVREVAPGVARAVGIDLSPKMIEQARELAKDFDNVELLVGDSESLPFADGEFTAILCSTSIHHYPDPERAILEMARLLAPGGRIVVADASRDRLSMRLFDRLCRRFQASHARILNSTELTRFLDQAGLARSGLRTLWHGRYMIASARKPEPER